jgi:hypothetical protein
MDHVKDKEQRAKHQRAYAHRHPERVRAKKRRVRLAKFGITPEIYDQMLVEQDGKCAICGVPCFVEKRALAVDHDHKTNSVRGLLCINCNTGLGKFKDNATVLMKAAQYLLREWA